MKRKANNSHFTLEARTYIENQLNENQSITSIARNLCRCKSSVIREIDRNITLTFPSTYNSTHPCIKSSTCLLKEYDCYKTCKNIEINLCPKLISSPHTCNGCTSKHGCRYVKKYYKANEANSKYLNSWKEDRIGLHYTEYELDILNNDFYYLVIANRSIYHSLIVINKRGFNFKKSTIYRQIKDNRLRLKLSDLPRNRKDTKMKEEKDKEYKNIEKIEGHTYEDLEIKKQEKTDAIETEMDTVEGVKDSGDPVMLTLEIVKISFMFIIKLDAKTFDNVLKKLKQFKEDITPEIFIKILELFLTDNGSEFKNISKLVEAFPDINIFYCHPYSSYEKGAIENNHELIRRVIPKSVSLKPYTQQDYNLLASHINSLYREKLNGKCPFELVEEYIPIEILNKMGLFRIKDEDVTLNPFLLGDKNVENIKKHLSYNEIKNSNISITKKQ